MIPKLLASWATYAASFVAGLVAGLLLIVMLPIGGWRGSWELAEVK